uniref:Uncharacterized protein n=1 Tax=Plectus sambesii TaxID=2011161 RepID=A0A914WZ69_9BILA
MLIIAILATVTIFILAALHLYFVRHFVSSRSRRIPLYWLLGLFPVSSACFLAGMMMPRAANFLFAIAWIYMMLCLIVLIETMKRLFGGRGEMSRLLIENKQNISFRVPPCCCCCKCLPSIYPSEKNLRRVEWMVYQTVAVRIIITVIAITLIAEMQDDVERLITILTCLSTIQNISMLLAIFGCHTLVTLARERLGSFRMLALFRIIDGTMGLFSLYDLFSNVLVKYNAFSCGPVLSKRGKSNYWYAFVLICGLSLMSCLATFLFHPRKSEIFDRHPCRSASQKTIASMEENDHEK